MRLTTIVRQRAADAAFGAFDDVEAGEDDHKLSVTVSERRTRALFTTVDKNEAKRAMQARAKTIRTPAQLEVKFIEEGAFRASHGAFTLTFPAPGGVTSVEPAEHPRINAWFKCAGV